MAYTKTQNETTVFHSDLLVVSFHSGLLAVSFYLLVRFCFVSVVSFVSFWV